MRVYLSGGSISIRGLGKIDVCGRASSSPPRARVEQKAGKAEFASRLLQRGRLIALAPALRLGFKPPGLLLPSLWLRSEWQRQLSWGPDRVSGRWVADKGSGMNGVGSLDFCLQRCPHEP